MIKRIFYTTCKLSLAIFLAIVAHSITNAQAWVPNAGQASVSVFYDYANVGKHLFSADVIDASGVNLGKSIDLGRIQAHSIHFNFEFGITNNVAVNLRLPWVVSRYDGTDPEDSTLDDGRYHGGFQNLALQFRYMTDIGQFVVTPFMSAVLPSHDYATLGHTAIGRNLRELHAGFFVGKLLTFISDDLFAQAGYEYTDVERHNDIKANRTNIDLTLGYFVTPTVTINTVISYQKTHGGMDWLDIADESMFLDHDRHAAANFLDLGLSGSLDVTDATSISISYSSMLWGENTHEIQSFALGFTQSFDIAPSF